MMDCIFCKILNGDIPSVKIRENDDFVAILDAFPNREAMTLVIPKKHYSSDITLVPDDVLKKASIAVKEVSNLLKDKLEDVTRVGVVVEGLEVDHLHFRLYPFYHNKGFVDGVGSGPQAKIEELEEIASKLK